LGRFFKISTGVCFLASIVVAAPAARKSSPNVVLITIDTVRADHMGCYGAKEVQTPTIDALARDGIVFERAISQVPLTWPSHAVILTGTYPFQNGVQDFTGQPLAPQFRSVAQAFKQHGYATGAVVSAFVLDRSWGLARGFDFYDDAFSPEAFQKRDLGLVDRKAGESVTHAINWLKQASRRPFFFWLHLYDPHSPYAPPEPFHTQYRDHLYDGEIAYADHELERLIAWLKSNHVYDRTMIVLLSDHGESLGDHGEKEHGFFVYNSTVHIPLIVKPPAGSGFRPGRIARPVETTAVAPALLAFEGIKDPVEKQFNSRGLLGAAAEKEDVAYSETFYPLNSFGWNPLHALETSRYHYVDAPEPELYDLAADPGEKNNLITAQGATAAVLKEKLRFLMQHNPYKPPEGGNSNLSPDALEKLRALGYVAYHSPVSPEALAAGLPDPKTKLEEFNSILAAEDAFYAHDFDKGERLLAKVREQDPKMYIVPFMLGEAEAAKKDWPAAESEFRKCLDLNSNFDQAMTGLSRALMYQNKDEEAKQWARNALKYNPQNYRAWYELGFIESKSDQQAAIADYERAVAIQGNFAPLRRDLGLLYYQQQNYAEAAKHLAKAAELGMNDARLLNFMGISYSRTNRVPLAIQSYKRALEIDPHLAEAHLNLGYAYEGLHKHALAKQEYQQACHLNANLCGVIKARTE
jgi:arylsulfatase A-like enzyme/Tfp pilus assembly protein PilF